MTKIDAETLNIYLNSTREVDEKILEEPSTTIMLNFSDTYANLPRKLKLSYEYLLKNTDADWFLKADDDMFVKYDKILSDVENIYSKVMKENERLEEKRQNFKNLLEKNPDNIQIKHALNQIPHNKTYFYFGCIKSHARVLHKGKWKEDFYTKSDVYPRFSLGSCGHIISRNVAEYIVENSEKLFEYQGEDTSLGIWLDEAPTKIKQSLHVQSIAGMSNRLKDGLLKSCVSGRFHVIGHKITPDMMRKCYDIIKNTKTGEKMNRLIPVVRVKRDENNNELEHAETEEMVEYYENLASIYL